MVHVQENSEDNNVTILDQQAGDWTITNTGRIYETATQLLEQNYHKRPRIVKVLGSGVGCRDLGISTR